MRRFAIIVTGFFFVFCTKSEAIGRFCSILGELLTLSFNGQVPIVHNSIAPHWNPTVHDMGVKEGIVFSDLSRVDDKSAFVFLTWDKKTERFVSLAVSSQPEHVFRLVQIAEEVTDTRPGGSVDLGLLYLAAVQNDLKGAPPTIWVHASQLEELAIDPVTNAGITRDFQLKCHSAGPQECLTLGKWLEDSGQPVNNFKRFEKLKTIPRVRPDGGLHPYDFIKGLVQ